MTTTTTTTVTTTNVVKPNIYNDKGCNSIGYCDNYIVYVDCIAELHAGISTCQTVHILDSNGQPIDIDRLSGIRINLMDEYDCLIMSTDTSISTENMQEKYIGPLFEITDKNFYSMSDRMFDTSNVKILSVDSICPDNTNTIKIGTVNGVSTEYGQIIFNPIKYNEELFVEVTPNTENTGKITCFVNGLPQQISLNEKVKLINAIDGTDIAVVNVTSFGDGFRQMISKIDSIKFSTIKGINNKGQLKICYNGNNIPSTSTITKAEIMLVFNMDDPVEKGSTKLIKCIHLADIKEHTYVYNTEID